MISVYCIDAISLHLEKNKKNPIFWIRQLAKQTDWVENFPFFWEYGRSFTGVKVTGLLDLFKPRLENVATCTNGFKQPSCLTNALKINNAVYVIRINARQKNEQIFYSFSFFLKIWFALFELSETLHFLDRTFCLLADSWSINGNGKSKQKIKLSSLQKLDCSVERILERWLRRKVSWSKKVQEL